MITTRFQKLGALVASLASILTLSSAAEAIVITGPGSSITTAAATGLPARSTTKNTSYITYGGTPFDIQSLNSVTINGLSLSGAKGQLAAKLTAFDVPSSTEVASVWLFSNFVASTAPSSSSSSISLGNYKFVPAAGYNQTWTASPTLASTPGTYSQFDTNFSTFNDFIGASFDSNTKWTLDITNGRSTNSGTGSFSSFSIDASPVPFESDAAPAGVVIVFGALMLRRKLQQRSAQKMSLELVNS
jgi:hypothetical protein